MRRIQLLILYSAALLLILCFAAAARAQTIAPVVVECSKKCSGEFSITNNGLTPLVVTLQPVSFSLNPTTGASVYRNLDNTVDLRLEEMSTRIGPKQSHSFGYSFKCDGPPCLITIVASMAVGHTAQGVVVRVSLPHTIYACEKAKNCRADARRAAGLVE